MSRPILLDANVMVAWLDRRDKDHTKCAAVLPGIKPPLVTCEAAVVESCHLLRRVGGASERLLENVANGIIQIPFKLSESSAMVRTILHKYRDMAVDLADACLIQMADELETGDILTLDSDFRHYRWRRNRKFNLLVPLD